MRAPSSWSSELSARSSHSASHNALYGIGRVQSHHDRHDPGDRIHVPGQPLLVVQAPPGPGHGAGHVVFFVLNGIGLLIYYGCIGLTDLAGLGKSKIWYYVALVVGTGLGTVFRFWSYRKWVWVAKDVSVLEPSEPPEELAQDLAAMVGAAPVTHHEQLSPVNQAGSSHAATGSHRAADPHRTPASHRAPASHRRTK